MARKGQPPAFQQYATDWVAETAELTAAARGILITLRSQAWLRRRLPSDEGGLARLGGVSRAELRRAWPSISHWFETPPEGGPFLMDPQLEAQHAALDAHRDKQKEKADARWESERNRANAREERDGGSGPKPAESPPADDAAASSRHMPDACSSPPSSSPSSPESNDPGSTFTSGDLGARLRVDRIALKAMWTAKTRLRGEFVAGLELAAARIEEYALVTGEDAMAIATRALDAFNEYCDTRSHGYRPAKDGYKFVEHWAKLEPVIAGHGAIEAAPQKRGAGPILVSGLDFSKKEGT